MLLINFQVFFILRKKSNQISFLHVYHHCGMVVGGWIITNFTPGGNAMLIILCNTAVHVCMYTYYLLSVYNENLKRNSFWKRRLTEIQLVISLTLYGSNKFYLYKSFFRYNLVLEFV